MYGKQWEWISGCVLWFAKGSMSLLSIRNRGEAIQRGLVLQFGVDEWEITYIKGKSGTYKREISDRNSLEGVGERDHGRVVEWEKRIWRFGQRELGVIDNKKTI